MPRMRTESFGSGDQTWLLSDHALFNAHTVTIDISTFTKATHYPDGYVPAGTLLNIANRAAVKPFTGAAGEKFGVLPFDQPTDGVADFAAPALWHGSIVTAKLPSTTNLPATAPAGWDFN